MNFSARFAPALRTAYLHVCHYQRPVVAAATTRTTTTTWIRSFSSGFGEESPLDKFLDPSAPTPLFESTEPYRPPARLLECGIDEKVLRFKTTCYGRLLKAPFVHPNEHKVVLAVSRKDLPLSRLEFKILKEIVGSRWHEDKRELRLQSVSFGSRIENKRHVVSMLDRLVLSCKRLAEQVHQMDAASSSEGAV